MCQETTARIGESDLRKAELTTKGKECKDFLSIGAAGLRASMDSTASPTEEQPDGDPIDGIVSGSGHRVIHREIKPAD